MLSYGRKNGKYNMNYYGESVQIEKDNSHLFNKIYMKLRPDIKTIETNKDKRTQLLGVDKILYLDNGCTYYIQEKCRPYKWYDDILLEYISNDRTMSPGWMEKDQLCNYLFYLVKYISQVYWFKWLPLKQLWDTNRDKWISYGEQRLYGFSRISAPNPDYNTISVGVPPDILLNNIPKSGVVDI